MKYVKIKTIKKVDSEPLYYMNVNKNENFIANNFVLHNCTYRGEIKLRLTPIFGQLMHNEYEVGDKCCQLVLLEQPKVGLEIVEELDDSVRGEGGYGSSDKPDKGIKIDKKI